MSRLIDADVEILKLEKEIKECEAKIKLLEENKTERSLYDVYAKIKDLKRNINDCKIEIRLLKRYETAYDVEAVVRELEDEMNKCYSGYEETCGIKLIAEGRGYEHAIEIVKRGGRNERTV